MSNHTDLVDTYLDYCSKQKRLDAKTIRAYRTDLEQLKTVIELTDPDAISTEELESYIQTLHTKYKPRTAKRKIASIKAFFSFLEHKNVLSQNPCHRLDSRFREPAVLPRTIPLHTLEQLLSAIYWEVTHAKTSYRRRNALRDAAICELLFATGVRISELCSLSSCDIDFKDNVILIFGKGAKERRIHIGNKQVTDILQKYKESYREEISQCGKFFANQHGRPFSDQSVRRMLNRYVKLSDIAQHITPHMFRHTFATSLLDSDVDIRYIQEILGHSSIHTTEIYTHVSMAKQKDILGTKNPRNQLAITTE